MTGRSSGSRTSTGAVDAEAVDSRRDRTRVAFLAQEEPLFVPGILRILADRLGDRLVGAGFFPPAPGAKSFKREYLDRFRYYGPVAFTRIALRYVGAKLARPGPAAVARARGIRPIEWDSGLLKDPELHALLRGLDLDVLLILGNQIVRPGLMAVPRLGCFNIHPSLLPRDRGREPVFHAMSRGDDEAGVTVHRMAEALDAGDVYGQTRIPVAPDDTVLGVTERLWLEGAELFCRMIDDIDAGTFTLEPQDEERATYNGFPDAEAAKDFRRRGGRFV